MILCLLSDVRDFCIVPDNTCVKCLAMKIRCIVLKTYDISKKDAKDFINLGVKGYNVKCECVST